MEKHCYIREDPTKKTKNSVHAVCLKVMEAVVRIIKNAYSE